MNRPIRTKGRYIYLLSLICLYIQIASCGSEQDPVTITFGVTPGVINYGDEANLNWNISLASNQSLQGVTIDPNIGIVNENGTITVSPNNTTEYTLTALINDSEGSQTQYTKKITLLVEQGTAWDWQRDDVYSDFNNIQILSPWKSDQHFGVDVTGYRHPAADGWRLFVKRLSCDDYIEGCSIADLPDYEDRRNFPYFALYNIHSGQLRIFVYINKPNFTGSKQLVVTSSITDTGFLSDYGLSLQETDFSLPLTEKDQQQNQQVFIMKSFVNKWAVMDRHLSYDPNAIPSSLALELFFEEKVTEEVNLAGTFEFSLTSQQSNGSKDILSSILKLPGTIKKNKKNIANSGQDIIDVSNDLRNSNNSLVDFPDGLLDRATAFGTFLIGNASTFGAIQGFIGGLDIISGLSNFSGKSSSVQYGSGTITLNGTIVNQFPQNQIAINLDDNTYRLNKDSLGLFSIVRSPQIWVQPYCGNTTMQSLNFSCPFVHRYIENSNDEIESEFRYTPASLTWRFEENLRDLVLVNPDSDMILTNIAVEPLIEYREPYYLRFKDNTGQDGGVIDDYRQFISWGSVTDEFDFSSRLAKITSTPFPSWATLDSFIGNRFLTETSTKTLETKVSASRQVVSRMVGRYYDEAETGNRFPADTGITCNCQPTRLEYRIYLSFVHKDEVGSTNPTIFSEHILTYKPELIIGSPGD